MEKTWLNFLLQPFKKLEKTVWKAIIMEWLSKVRCDNGKLLAEVLQGCVLSLVMFHISFNDLDDAIERMLITFTDGTNLVD